MDNHIEIKLRIKIFKDNNYFIAYSPELQIATQGKTKKEVKKRFEERASIFIEMALEKGALEKRLHELGWKNVKNEPVPPKEVTVPMELLMAKECNSMNYHYAF